MKTVISSSERHVYVEDVNKDKSYVYKDRYYEVYQLRYVAHGKYAFIPLFGVAPKEQKFVSSSPMLAVDKALKSGYIVIEFKYEVDFLHLDEVPESPV